MLMLWNPGGLRLPGDSAAPPEFADLVYYSFVTLTTLGYGEITPVDRLVRTLAILEAVAGPFYLAVIVAALAGRLVAESRGTGGDDGAGVRTRS